MYGLGRVGGSPTIDSGKTANTQIWLANNIKFIIIHKVAKISPYGKTEEKNATIR